MERSAYRLDVKSTLTALKSEAGGLSENEAKVRLDRYGHNMLPIVRRGIVEIFFKRLTGFFVLLLIVASILTYLSGELLESAVLLCIAVVNLLITFIQELQAEQAVGSLAQEMVVNTLVLRSGQATLIESKFLVPGDVVTLTRGARIPADLRIITSDDLYIDESTFTGESQPVHKAVRAILKSCPLIERHNMAYAGTVVTGGQGLGVVVATGKQTELGKISSQLPSTSAVTPLEDKLRLLGSVLTLLVGVFVALLFFLGTLRGDATLELLVVSIALLVAAVPESLPTVLTASVARISTLLARRGAIVRNLAALEALGEVNVVVTDKTGTLTRNEQTIVEAKLFSRGKLISVEFTGRGYQPEGQIRFIGQKQNHQKILLRSVLVSALLAGDGELTDTPSGRRLLVGDPVDGAIYVAAEKFNLIPAAIRRLHQLVKYVPFDDRSRIVLGIYRDQIAVKGAPEAVIARCKLSASDRSLILAAANQLAAEGFRIIAVGALRHPKDAQLSSMLIQSVTDSKDVTGLSFLGLFACLDPERSTSRQALADLNRLGVASVLVTGDHRETARSLVVRLGWKLRPAQLLSGEQVMSLSKRELLSQVKDARLYYRCGPEEKHRVVSALMDRGNTVAVIGDGVNDAPILKAAHVGVSMGLSGTDSARESSDIVLADDQFSTIVSAILSGRQLVTNIAQTVLFLLSGNLAELLFIGLLPLVGLPFPLTSVQVIWVNLASDLFPALALAFRPAGTVKELTQIKSIRLTKQLFGRAIFLGVSLAVMAGVVYVSYLAESLSMARTMGYLAIVAAQLGIAGSLLFPSPVWRLSFADLIRYPAGIVSLCIAALVHGLTLHPRLQVVFATTSIDWSDLTTIIAVSIIGLFLAELTKSPFFSQIPSFGFSQDPFVLERRP